MTKKDFFPVTRHDQVFGMLAYKGPAKSLEEMEQCLPSPSELADAGYDAGTFPTDHVDNRAKPSHDEGGSDPRIKV